MRQFRGRVSDLSHTVKCRRRFCTVSEQESLRNRSNFTPSNGFCSVMQLKHPKPCTIALLGTQHFSAESAPRVHRVIRAIQPETIAIELEPKKLERMKKQMMRTMDPVLKKKKKEEGKEEDSEDEGEGRIHWQPSRMKLFNYGNEIEAAFEAAYQRDCEIICIDKRLPFLNTEIPKAKMKDYWLSRQLEPEMETSRNIPNMRRQRLKDRCNRESMIEFRLFYRQKYKEHAYVNPNFCKIIKDDRDEHMAQKIIECIQYEGQRVVVIAGMLHMDGLEWLLFREGLGQFVTVDKLRDLIVYP